MVDSYLAQQIKHTHLENYAFNEIVLWLHKLLKPTNVNEYRDLIDIAELLWDRVGRGTTRLEELDFKQWMRHAK